MTSHFSLEQNLSQTQMLSPQMQQSLHVLQAPLMELRALVEQEMQSNPVLEEENSLSEEFESPTGEGQEPGSFEITEEPNASQTQEDLDFLWKSQPLVSRDELQRKREYLFDTLTSQESLADHLLSQLAFAPTSRKCRQAAEIIVGSLDENGFLRVSLEEVAATAEAPLLEAEAALELVQSFHPSGVGARDLKETLLIQLRQRGREDGLEAEIVKQGLDLLARRKYEELARQLGVNEKEIQEAARYIAQLQPRPGAAFATDQPQDIILPEATILKIHQEWVVQMNGEPLPQLKINDLYKDLLTDGTQQAPVRLYLKEKIHAGRFFIQSLQHRQETLEKILKQVVIHQRDFLEHGRAFLKPLTMRTIAELVGVHETTVGRAIANKYVQTPWGTVAMRFFFDSGYQTQAGEALASTSVKEALAHLIAQEDRRKPLSDAALVKRLSERGIVLARRTVSKYREELHILPSSLRKNRL